MMKTQELRSLERSIIMASLILRWNVMIGYNEMSDYNFK